MGKLRDRRRFLLLGQRPVTYLLRDEFTTTEAAPLASPRTAEPGPGIATIVDTNNTFSITSEALEWNAVGASANWTDPRLEYTDGLTRTTGLGLFMAINGTAFSNQIFGFQNVTGGGTGALIHGWYPRSSDVLMWPGSINVSGVLSTSTDYVLAVVARSTGAWMLIKGGAFTNWTLFWVFDTSSDATLYPGLIKGTLTTTINFNYMRARQLAAPWQDDYGIITGRKAGSVSASTTFAHEADCLIEFNVATVPSAGSIKVFFRVQDASNYWEIDIDNTGALVLNEVVASSPTSRGSAAGVVANGDRIVIIADDTTIRVFEANTLRITYASASNFKTETTGELDSLGTGGAVDDLVTWPRTISGSAKTELDRE